VTKEQENQDMMSQIITRADKMIEKINFIRDKLMDRCELLHTKNVDVIEKKILQLDTRIELAGRLLSSFDKSRISEITVPNICFNAISLSSPSA
jgi:hypothetical protein